MRNMHFIVIEYSIEKSGAKHGQSLITIKRVKTISGLVKKNEREFQSREQLGGNPDHQLSKTGHNPYQLTLTFNVRKF